MERRRRPIEDLGFSPEHKGGGQEGGNTSSSPPRRSTTSRTSPTTCPPRWPRISPGRAPDPAITEMIWDLRWTRRSPSDLEQGVTGETPTASLLHRPLAARAAKEGDQQHPQRPPPPGPTPHHHPRPPSPTPEPSARGAEQRDPRRHLHRRPCGLSRRPPRVATREGKGGGRWRRGGTLVAPESPSGGRREGQTTRPCSIPEVESKYVLCIDENTLTSESNVPKPA